MVSRVVLSVRSKVAMGPKDSKWSVFLKLKAEVCSNGGEDQSLFWRMIAKTGGEQSAAGVSVLCVTSSGQLGDRLTTKSSPKLPPGPSQRWWWSQNIQGETKSTEPPSKNNPTAFPSLISFYLWKRRTRKNEEGAENLMSEEKGNKRRPEEISTCCFIILHWFLLLSESLQRGKRHHTKDCLLIQQKPPSVLYRLTITFCTMHSILFLLKDNYFLIICLPWAKTTV